MNVSASLDLCGITGMILGSAAAQPPHQSRGEDGAVISRRCGEVSALVWVGRGIAIQHVWNCLLCTDLGRCHSHGTTRSTPITPPSALPPIRT